MFRIGRLERWPATRQPSVWWDWVRKGKLTRVAAIGIGLILGYVAVQLARRNGDFLVGRRASTNIHERIQKVIASQPGVRAVTELLVTFLGPRRLWVIARIDIDDDLDGPGVKALVRAIEQALTHASRFVGRIDVVPASREA